MRMEARLTRRSVDAHGGDAADEERRLVRLVQPAHRLRVRRVALVHHPRPLLVLGQPPLPQLRHAPARGAGAGEADGRADDDGDGAAVGDDAVVVAEDAAAVEERHGEAHELLHARLQRLGPGGVLHVVHVRLPEGQHRHQRRLVQQRLRPRTARQRLPETARAVRNNAGRGAARRGAARRLGCCCCGERGRTRAKRVVF
jgi:hypothetical protein